jgi:hypothetical protein
MEDIFDSAFFRVTGFQKQSYLNMFCLYILYV